MKPNNVLFTLCRYGTLLVVCALLPHLVLAAKKPIYTNIKLHQMQGDKFEFSGATKNMAVFGDNVYILSETFAESDGEFFMSILLSKSTNGGLSFTAPKVISTTGMMASIIVNEQGHVLITYVEPKKEEGPYLIYFMKSTNGGESFSTPLKLTKEGFTLCAFPAIASHGNQVYLAYFDFETSHCFIHCSTNGGDSFETAVKINDVAIASNIYYSDIVAVCTDTEGTVYLAWVDGRRVDSNGDVYFAKSINSGRSFTPALRVNTLESAIANKYKSEVKLAAKGDNVYISYITDTGFNRVTYFSKSTNKGVSFLPEIPFAWHNSFSAAFDMTLAPDGTIFAVMSSTPTSIGHNVNLLESTNQGNNFLPSRKVNASSVVSFSGMNVVTNEEGVPCMAWIEEEEMAESEKRTLFFAKEEMVTSVDLPNKQLTDLASVAFSKANNAIRVSPFTASTPVTVSVYDVQGQLLAVSSASAGEQMLLGQSLAPGLYWVLVQANGKNQVVKCIKK